MMSDNVIAFRLRTGESAETLQDRYFGTLRDLQRDFPEVAWPRVESLLTSYGQFCVAFCSEKAA